RLESLIMERLLYQSLGCRARGDRQRSRLTDWRIWLPYHHHGGDMPLRQLGESFASMQLSGLLAVLVFTGIFASIYALLSLGLNLQWGYPGLFNVGVAGFYAIGAYTSALLTTPPSPYHLGGFNLPIPVGMLGALVTSGVLAYIVGLPTLRLREDY